MKAVNLIKGNLDNFHFRKTILEKGKILYQSSLKSRNNWGIRFQEMHLNNDDKLLMDDIFVDDEFVITFK